MIKSLLGTNSNSHCPPQVLWAQQMFRKVRVKRWIVPEEEEEPALDRLIGNLDDEDLLEYLQSRYSIH